VALTTRYFFVGKEQEKTNRPHVIGKSPFIALVKSKGYAREMGKRFAINFKGLEEANSRQSTEYVKKSHFHG